MERKDQAITTAEGKLKYFVLPELAGPVVECAVVAAASAKPIKTWQHYRRRRSFCKHPDQTRLFLTIQLLLGLSLLAVSLYGFALPIWSAFVPRPSLPFNDRHISYLYALYSTLVALNCFCLLGVVIGKPVNLCMYTTMAMRLLCIFVCDLLWLTWFAFVHLVHYRPHEDISTSILVLFFSPSAVSLARLLLVPTFVLHFDGHFSEVKWRTETITPRTYAPQQWNKTRSQGLKLQQDGLLKTRQSLSGKQGNGNGQENRSNEDSNSISDSKSSSAGPNVTTAPHNQTVALKRRNVIKSKSVTVKSTVTNTTNQLSGKIK